MGLRRSLAKKIRFFLQVYAKSAEESRGIDDFDCLTCCPSLCYVFGMETAAYLRHVVTTLAQNIGVRSYRDIDKLKRAAAYISSEFTSFGYEVEHQPFFFFGNIYHNLVAELAGSSSPKDILVVGAHYDTVRTTPGADDNASGVA